MKKMAQVTVELRHLLETDFELFDFDYTFDDLNFKKQLEEHIINYYYDYEIGQETPDMFKRKFVTRWKRIIPYYNELYNTTLLTYNPLSNYSMTEALKEIQTNTQNQTATQEQSERGNENSSTSMSARGTTSNEDENIISSEDSSNTKKSDYPQQSITTGSYLSDESITDNLSSSTTNTTSTTTSSDSSNASNEMITSKTVESTNNKQTTDNSNRNYEKTIEGITGVTYQELIKQQRENILRIPDMVVREMKPCFVLVY